MKIYSQKLIMLKTTHTTSCDKKIKHKKLKQREK